MTNIPKDLRYSEHDEWIRVDGDEAAIGITDYAQDQLSDIVFLELPEEGDEFDDMVPESCKKLSPEAEMKMLP